MSVYHDDTDDDTASLASSDPSIQCDCCGALEFGDVLQTTDACPRAYPWSPLVSSAHHLHRHHNNPDILAFRLPGYPHQSSAIHDIYCFLYLPWLDYEHPVYCCTRPTIWIEYTQCDNAYIALAIIATVSARLPPRCLGRCKCLHELI